MSLSKLIGRVLQCELDSLRAEMVEDSLVCGRRCPDRETAAIAVDLAMNSIANQLLIVIGDHLLSHRFTPSELVQYIREIWTMCQKDPCQFAQMRALATGRAYARGIAGKGGKP